jgi:serine phosphatase RsbU (regulator of sigma subunit)
VPPALAGVGAATVRRPLVYGGLSLATAIAIAAGAFGSAGWLSAATIISVVAVTAVSALGTMGSARGDEKLTNVISVAEAAQRALLRPLPSRVGPVGLGVVYLAAAAEAKVGGDLYEVARTPHGIRLIIGDVRGKGLGAVETAADVLGIFREVAHDVYTLAEVARRLDAGLVRRWAEREEFVTALLLEIAPDAGRLTIYNCGHPPPILLHGEPGSTLPREVTVVEVPAPAPPLGLLSLGDSSGAGRTLDFKPGDQLLLYTDGVTEARDSRRAFYPLRERLAELAGPPDGQDGHHPELLERLRADLLRHVGAPLDDDAALLLVTAPAAWAPEPAEPLDDQEIH